MLLTISLLSIIIGMSAAGLAVYTLITLQRLPTTDKIRENVNEVKDSILDIKRGLSAVETAHTDLREIVETRYSRMATRLSRENKEDQREQFKKLLEQQLENSSTQQQLEFGSNQAQPNGLKPKLRKG
jgi:hypothetical protein